MTQVKDQVMTLIRRSKCNFNDDELPQCQDTLRILKELRNKAGYVISLIDVDRIKVITLDNDGLIFVTRYNDKFYVIDTVEKEIRSTYDSIKDFLTKYVTHDDTVIIVVSDDAVYEISEIKVMVANKEYVIPHVEKYVIETY